MEGFTFSSLFTFIEFYYIDLLEFWGRLKQWTLIFGTFSLMLFGGIGIRDFDFWEIGIQDFDLRNFDFRENEFGILVGYCKKISKDMKSKINMEMKELTSNMKTKSSRFQKPHVSKK